MKRIFINIEIFEQEGDDYQKQWERKTIVKLENLSDTESFRNLSLFIRYVKKHLLKV